MLIEGGKTFVVMVTGAPDICVHPEDCRCVDLQGHFHLYYSIKASRGVK